MIKRISKIVRIREIIQVFFELWAKLEKMQEKSWNSYRMDYKKVQDLTEIFENRAEKIENNRDK